MTPMIKPLTWFEVEKSRLGGKYTSDGYTIRYIEGLWLLDFAGNSKSAWRFPTIELAQAAAQADYAARIAAAIDPAWLARMESLVTAADGLADAIAPVAALVAGSGIDFKRKYPELNAVLDKSRQDEWHDIIGWIVADALTTFRAAKEAANG